MVAESRVGSWLADLMRHLRHRGARGELVMVMVVLLLLQLVLLEYLCALMAKEWIVLSWKWKTAQFGR